MKSNRSYLVKHLALFIISIVLLYLGAFYSTLNWQHLEFTFRNSVFRQLLNNVSLVAILYLELYLISKYKLTSVIAVVSLLIYAFYVPFVSIFGSINPSFIEIILNSNLTESKQFLSSFPLYTLYLSAIVLICAGVLHKCCEHLVISKKYCSIALFVLSIAALIAFLISKPIHLKQWYKSYNIYQEARFNFSNIPVSDWQISATQNRAKDVYVVVIGESVRKDYLSVYGYKQATTPFLSASKGIFIDGFVAPAPYTIPSLTRMLNFTTNETGIQFNNSIVDLLNKLNYQSYWFSSQNKVGKHDNGVSSIANRTKYTEFISEAGYTDDFILLEYLKKSLTNAGKKVIFLHMIGSHSNACDRLNNFKLAFDNLPIDENCYASSILKLDSFLQQAIEILQQQTKNYSLIYFSDHGQVNDSFGIHHGDYAKQAYEVPFIILDPSIQEHQVIKRPIQGIHFLDLFVSWMGLKTNLTNDAFNIYAYPSEEIFITNYNDKLLKYNELKDNPAP